MRLFIGFLFLASTLAFAVSRYPVVAHQISQLTSQRALKDKTVRADKLAENRQLTLNLVQFKDTIRPHYHKKHDEIVIVVSSGGADTCPLK